jgi:DnaJ-domain-containing protein 1
MIFLYIFGSFWLIGVIAGLLYMWDEQKRPPREPSAKEAAPDLVRLRQLAFLGLDEHATKRDIKSAYKRLSRIHHPDRFSGMSGDASEQAAESFRRIREAYEFLS